MAAVLASGPGALLSHFGAAVLWGLLRRTEGDPVVEVLVHGANRPRRKGIRAHRQLAPLDRDAATRQGIPVTAPVRTLIDIAPRLSQSALEATVKKADLMDLPPHALRDGLEGRLPTRGVARLRATLDHHSFRITDSVLERKFLALVKNAGLPLPVTGARLHGHEVDFHWPALGLVVETDGLTYHRTEIQQARDRVRDQTLTAAGLIILRFTHAQVSSQPHYVAATLARAMARIRAS